MDPASRVLLYVGATFCIIAIAFAGAVIFIPEFNTDKAFLVGTILGSLTTMAGIILGTSKAKQIGDQIRRNNGGSGGSGDSEK
jgi:hypothetical protein